jgi:hypothetical protein
MRVITELKLIKHHKQLLYINAFYPPETRLLLQITNTLYRKKSGEVKSGHIIFQGSFDIIRPQKVWNIASSFAWMPGSTTFNI